MADNEERVTYKAVADFTSVGRAADRLIQKIRQLRKEEAALNSESVAGETQTAAARGKHTAEISKQSQALEAAAKAADKASRAASKSTTETNKSKVAFKDAGTEAGRMASAVDRGAQAASRSTSIYNKLGAAAKRLVPSFRAGGKEMSGMSRYASLATGQLGKLQKNLNKLRDWRPRLIPPFIALVPVIASLLALVNPLVAGFGSIVPVALGFASSLGTLAGAALGAAPALAGLLATVFALKTAFGGIGGAFKAFGKTPAGGGGGGGGGGAAPKADKPIELTQTEKITRAQEDYARSVQDVTFAEEDLDDARKDYIKRVKELQQAVDRAAMSQARANANTRLAQENYANVLADPGSTKGAKMDALAGVKEARADAKDVASENKQNAKDLQDLKRTGINGDRQVIQSQRAVTDAVRAQRDAQIALQNAIKGTSDAATGGGGGGGAGAIDEYAAALAKLSPSARKFVEAIVAMKPEMDKLKRTVQEAFFSQFVKDIELLRNLFPPVTSLLSDVAAAAGRVADKFLLMVTSEAWTDDIKAFGKEFAPILEDVGDAFLALLDGFRNLTMAVTPFLGRVAARFKDFTEDLRDTLGAARKDGSLAAYMERVGAAWDQWWRVIKNVGTTLFNYSSASSEFGQWLTDGLEKLTESWVKNSEEARKKGSGYQQWLEELKPLLREVKGLFGDFFGYLHDEATDSDNIKMFTDLVKIIREDVGPAIGRILDALSKSGVGESLAKAVGAILDAIADFLDNGGAEGMAAFFDVIAGLAKAAGDFVSALPKPVVKFITESFAVLAALTFVGLNALIGNLIRLGASKGLMSILKLIPGVGKLAGKGGLGTLLLGGGGKHVGKGGIGALLGLGKGGKLAGAGKGLLRGLGKGGILGLIGGLTADVGADAIRDANKGPAGDKGSGARVGANALSGAGTGAGIGATVGSVIPGVGTAIGAGVGGVIGAGVGVATSDSKDKERFFSDWGKQIKENWEYLAKSWQDMIQDFKDGWETITEWWSGLIGDISEWFFGVIEKLVNFSLQISLWFSGVIQDIRDGWASITDWWNGLITNVSTWWQEVIDGLVRFTLKITLWWSDVIGRAKKVWSDVRQWWRDTAQSAQRVWSIVKGWWSDTVKTAAGIWSKIKTAWNDPIGAAKGIWADIKTWWSNSASAAGSIWDEIKGWFQTAADKAAAVGKGILGGGLAGGIADALKRGKGKNSGGVIRRAGGGSVPGRGNGDTVPAMLTPGEFVVRKAIVSRIGVENLQRINSGLMGFAQMASRAQQEHPSSDTKGGISFLNGGGLVPQLSNATSAKMSQVASQQASVSNDYSMHFGDIIVQNPVAERTSDSIPKAIRRSSSMGALRRERTND